MKAFYLSTLLACLCVAAPVAQGYQLTPLNITVAPSGGRASTTIELFNNQSEPVALELSVVPRAHDLAGTELPAEPSDDFLIYPAQLVLLPGQRQSVRVSWLGEPRPAAELAYRLIVEQVVVQTEAAPVEEPKGILVNMKVSTNYKAALYVRPKGCQPDVRVKSVEPATGPDGQRMLALTLENRGRAHGLLEALTLTLKAGGRSVELGTDDLKEIKKTNFLAGMTRRYLVPRPAGLPDGPVSAKLKLTFE